MATKITWQINAVVGAASTIYLWKLSNLITGDINYLPVSGTSFTMEVSPNPTTGSIVTTPYYTFVWRKDELNQIEIDILDVKFIGGSGTPNYNTPATDLASILALI